GLCAPCAALDRLRSPDEAERRLCARTPRYAGGGGAVFAADERGGLRMSHPYPAVASSTLSQGARAGGGRAAAGRPPLVAFHGNGSQTDAAAGDRNPGGASDEPRRDRPISRRRSAAVAEPRLRLRPARMRRARHVSLQAWPGRREVPSRDRRPDRTRPRAGPAVTGVAPSLESPPFREKSAIP